MYTPNNIADWFISKLNFDAGDTISPLKLQKLVYYGQAWHFTIFGKPLFEERIEAWTHGPVEPGLYQRFAETCRECTIEIDESELELVEIEPETERLLNEVLAIYGEHSASYLEKLTHTEAPWIQARKDCLPFERCTNEIPLESMREFYSTKLVG